MTSFYRALRFYPPLVEAEKPELLEAISTQWGCDDPQTQAACQTLIRLKQFRQEVLEAIQRWNRDNGGL